MTAAEKNYNKALAELQEEILRVSYILFPALALALNTCYGWKKDRITKVYKVCQSTWQECASTEGLSMIQMCCDETGIAVTNDSEKDFEELAYLSEKYWQEAKKHNHFKTREQELIYVATARRKQKQWIEAVITSGLFLALHRAEGFGYKRCIRVNEVMRQYLEDTNKDARLLCDLCQNKLHLNLETENGFFFFEGGLENDKQVI